MHVREMSARVEQFLNDANRLQWKKNKDYHPDDVAFLEAMRTAAESNITVEQDLWGRVAKQKAAIRRFLIDGHLESEPIEQRLMDVAVYMGMLNTWVTHKDVLLRDAMVFVTHLPCDPGAHRTHSDPCSRCLLYDWIVRTHKTR